MTIKTSTKDALDEAVAKDIPYIAAFIEDGIATTYSSGSNTREILRATSHALLQIILHNEEKELTVEDQIELVVFATEIIKEQTLELLEKVHTFSETAN